MEALISGHKHRVWAIRLLNSVLYLPFLYFFFNSDDFGKKFRRINAEIFNTHVRKGGGIMKSPVNPKKVC